MNLKRFTIVFALLALLTAAVSAHDDAGAARSKLGKHAAPGFSLADSALLEATGLDAQALRAALAEGSTIAELIEANDGDVESVIAEIAAQMSDDINANVTAYLESLDERVSEELHTQQSRRGPWGRRWLRHPRIFAYAGVSDTLFEATGLEAAGLRAALTEGATLAELIEANDGDVTEIAAAILATITDEAQAAAAERIEGLEERLSELFNSDLSQHWRRRRMKPHFYFGFWGAYGEPAAKEPAA